jgi:hypothetical protein
MAMPLGPFQPDPFRIYRASETVSRSRPMPCEASKHSGL